MDFAVAKFPCPLCPFRLSEEKAKLKSVGVLPPSDPKILGEVLDLVGGANEKLKGVSLIPFDCVCF